MSERACLCGKVIVVVVRVITMVIDIFYGTRRNFEIIVAVM